jgi:hypothetical protein
MTRKSAFAFLVLLMIVAANCSTAVKAVDIGAFTKHLSGISGSEVIPKYLNGKVGDTFNVTQASEIHGTTTWTIKDARGNVKATVQTTELNPTVIVSTVGWERGSYTISTDDPDTAYLQITKNVGGFAIPVEKLGLLAPYIALASIAIGAVVTGICAKRIKNKERR